MNILKDKVFSILLIILCCMMFVGCKKPTYDFEEKISIDTIYNKEEDSYLIYFYMDKCPFCESCYKTIKNYLKNYDNETMTKLYVCNLSDEGNQILKRIYEGENGQGTSGSYFVDGVTNYNDLYIAGTPSLIQINSDKTSSFITSGRSKILNYFNNIK